MTLEEEQRKLQLRKNPKGKGRLDVTDRGRGLFEYSKIFGNNPKGNITNMEGLIMDYVQRQRHAVWVDLGCGHGIGLREGKKYLEEKGIGRRLRTYGYDALPNDTSTIGETTPDVLELLAEKYAPVLIQGNMETAVFKEKPDIVTCVFALLWTKNPLRVFSNAATQANIGAVLCFNGMQFMHLPENNVFSMIRKTGSLPGFEIITYTGSKLVARKTQELDDFAYGFRLVSTCKDWPYLARYERRRA
ncbi:MAG: class I SAM-dependent methyltransferase [Nanoarchaeota archaeon]|nr:class I SAM-dependent methyltransferase [Nanoarchaeota archaeon]